MVTECYPGAMEIRLPPEKEAHLAALAASVGRSPDDIVQEAVALWEARRTEQLRTAKRKHTPARRLPASGSSARVSACPKA